MPPQGWAASIPTMEIDHDAPTPPYRQIAADIVDDIRAGRLQPGRPIPSEATMVQRYGVARDTVRRAVKWLREEGWVHTVPHRGTYVREPEAWPQA